MGLDNGIVLKAKTSRGIEYLAENHSFYFYDSGDEIGYWRKCWNIRNKVLNAFNDKGYDGDGGYINLTSVEDLVNMAETLKYFLHEENWDEDESIWEWYIELPPIADAIKKLRCLIEDIENEDISIDDLNIYFYDSY